MNANILEKKIDEVVVSLFINATKIESGSVSKLILSALVKPTINPVIKPVKHTAPRIKYIHLYLAKCSKTANLNIELFLEKFFPLNIIKNM